MKFYLNFVDHILFALQIPSQVRNSVYFKDVTIHQNETSNSYRRNGVECVLSANNSSNKIYPNMVYPNHLYVPITPIYPQYISLIQL